MNRARAIGMIEQWVERDAEAIVELCSSLIQCKTPSDPGDTRMAAEVVSAFLEEKGIAFEVVSKTETMPNIVASFDGAKPGSRFMFNGHMDTMPAGSDPQSVLRKIRRVVKKHPYAKVSSEGADAGECSDPAHPFVGFVRDASVAFGGPAPMPVPDIALSDCRYWRYEGTPAFWYGPDGSLCSLANEHVEIEELLHLVRVYTLAVFDYLQE